MKESNVLEFYLQGLRFCSKDMDGGGSPLRSGLGGTSVAAVGREHGDDKVSGGGGGDVEEGLPFPR
ncbi:hypothetical protein Fmac_002231 [Flemingia macrophylla]|uniref:Uncharacterized protein n=1 Tax=Flemingia macrophylla TaxID=520843 RepID=A0ABD1NJH5_9FABA